jgi:hypothetical protein
MPAEEVARHDDQQPKPQYEHEYCEGVGDEIGKGESAFEKHCRPPARPAPRPSLQQGETV